MGLHDLLNESQEDQPKVSFNKSLAESYDSACRVDRLTFPGIFYTGYASGGAGPVQQTGCLHAHAGTRASSISSG